MICPTNAPGCSSSARRSLITDSSLSQKAVSKYRRKASRSPIASVTGVIWCSTIRLLGGEQGGQEVRCGPIDVGIYQAGATGLVERQLLRLRQRARHRDDRPPVQPRQVAAKGHQDAL